jgi:hypothetical protein
MICIIALVVFGILGIFSLRYRLLAVEAFGCVLRRIVLRPCQTGLDERARAWITGKIMKFCPFCAGFFYRRFRIFEFALALVFVWSIVQTGVSGYNYYMYGNCNGYDASGFCVFDPAGHNAQFTGIDLSCGASSQSEKNLSISGVNLSIFPVLNRGDKNNVVFFIGCYECNFTKETYPKIKQLIEEHNVTVIFGHLPITPNLEVFTRYANCVYENAPEKFNEFNDFMFSISIRGCSVNACENALKSARLNMSSYAACANSTKIVEISRRQEDELKSVGVYGTPTIFINGRAFVGPKPYRVYERALE